MANAAIVVFTTVIIYFHCLTVFVVVYCANFVFFFFFSIQGQHVVFHLAVLFRFYNLLVVVPKYNDDVDRSTAKLFTVVVTGTSVSNLNSADFFLLTGVLCRCIFLITIASVLSGFKVHLRPANSVRTESSH